MGKVSKKKWGGAAPFDAQRVFSGREGLAAVVGRERAEALQPVLERYPFRASAYYLSLADLVDPGDPIALQCIPDRREVSDGPGTLEDPFTERAHSPVHGLVHRFADRVVVVATSRCAVYCRHCTRKNTLNALALDGARSALGRILNYVRAHPRIREVIVSGGDPLLMERTDLDRMLTGLAAIPTVEALRIGTRVPVVLPAWLDEDLCDLLAAHRPLWVNTQFNHPREVTPDSLAACERLLVRGLPVSNQSVLLEGVNTSVRTMRALCNALQRNMIRPYYCFLCDPVRGTRHFRTDAATGARLSEALRTSVGGLSLPRFVADLPREEGKLPLAQWKEKGQARSNADAEETGKGVRIS
jgi:lysine 2,3-aminomutase